MKSAAVIQSKLPSNPDTRRKWLLMLAGSVTQVIYIVSFSHSMPSQHAEAV